MPMYSAKGYPASRRERARDPITGKRYTGAGLSEYQLRKKPVVTIDLRKEGTYGVPAIRPETAVDPYNRGPETGRSRIPEYAGWRPAFPTSGWARALPWVRNALRAHPILGRAMDLWSLADALGMFDTMGDYAGDTYDVGHRDSPVSNPPGTWALIEECTPRPGPCNEWDASTVYLPGVCYVGAYFLLGGPCNPYALRHNVKYINQWTKQHETIKIGDKLRVWENTDPFGGWKKGPLPGWRPTRLPVPSLKTRLMELVIAETNRQAGEPSNKAETRQRGYERPATVTEVSVNGNGPGGVKTKTGFGHHKEVAPTRGTKEHKRRVPRLLLRIVSAITEGADIIDAMWHSLEKRPRGFYGPLEKVEYLYEHFDEVDQVQFGFNLIVMEAQDRFIAWGAGKRREALTEWGMQLGLPVSENWLRRAMRHVERMLEIHEHATTR